MQPPSTRLAKLHGLAQAGGVSQATWVAINKGADTAPQVRLPKTLHPKFAEILALARRPSDGAMRQTAGSRGTTLLTPTFNRSPPKPFLLGSASTPSLHPSTTGPSTDHTIPQALGTLEDRARERRAKCLQALRRSPEERSPDESVLLQEWAARIKFRDEEVQRVADPLTLSKAMRIRPTTPDEIIISQGEEGGKRTPHSPQSPMPLVRFPLTSAPSPAAALVAFLDAFYILFSGTATVYVAYDVIADPKAGALWPETLIRNVDSRIRRLRKHARGQFTPEPIPRFKKKTTTRQNGPSEKAAPPSTVTDPRGNSGAVATQQLPKLADIVEDQKSSTETVVASSEQAGLQHVWTYTEYDTFGDLALLFGAPRSASVVAEEDTILIRVERADYNKVLRDATIEAVRQRATFLSTLPVLSSLHFQHLIKIASYTKREDHPRGAHLLSQGRADDVLIIQAGEVDVQRCGARVVPRRLLTLGSGTCIGTLSMTPDVSRSLLPSLVASQHSSCTVLRLTRAEFEFRAGRQVVQLLAIAEANAWLKRLHSPGPLRALTGASSITSSIAILRNPAKLKLATVLNDTSAQSRSASSPSLRAGSNIDRQSIQTTEDLTAWLEFAGESLTAVMAKEANKRCLKEALTRQGQALRESDWSEKKRELVQAHEELTVWLEENHHAEADTTTAVVTDNDELEAAMAELESTTGLLDECDDNVLRRHSV